MSKSNKVVVIGVDGATFDLIKPWTEQGRLPNFKELMSSGCQGILESTIPPITGPAWTSFQTGKNPGEHGIFDWLQRKKGNYGLEPVNSSGIDLPTLWDYIGNQGKRSGIINVPVTYPPTNINGFLVSGMLTPSKDKQFTYPPSLKQEINEELGDYHITPPRRFQKRDIEGWVKGLKNMVETRKNLAKWGLRNRDWDFFMVHFTATDVVQHRMWDIVKSPENPVMQIYKEVDQAIQEISSNLPEGTSTLVISDHGFGPLYNHIYLNNWLLKEGYLSLKKDPITQFKKLMYKVGLTPANGYKILNQLGLLDKTLKLGKGDRYNLVSTFFLSADNIDWKNTEAYSHGNIGQIYLNRVEREPKGVVKEDEVDSLSNEIVGKLKRLSDERVNGKVFGEVFRKDEIYHGAKIDQAPEIMLLPKNLESMAVGASEFVSNKIIEPSFAFSGGHRMDGILIGNGPIFKNDDLGKAKLIDLAPTILYAMGLSIPEDLDGEILDVMFKKEFKDNNEKVYQKNPMSNKEGLDSKFSGDEEEKIKDRLEDLGYLT